MEPLMDGLEPQQECWNGVGCGGAMLLPRLGGLVVCSGMDGAFAHVIIMANRVLLNDGGCQFQI
jgi:hypothetical protein